MRCAVDGAAGDAAKVERLIDLKYGSSAAYQCIVPILPAAACPYRWKQWHLINSCSCCCSLLLLPLFVEEVKGFLC